MSLAQEQLEAIASYFAENIPSANVEPEPLMEASPVCVVIVKRPYHQHRVGICRPLIEDGNHSVAEVKRLLVRDDLAQEIQRFDRKEYLWNPV